MERGRPEAVSKAGSMRSARSVALERKSSSEDRWYAERRPPRMRIVVWMVVLSWNKRSEKSLPRKCCNSRHGRRSVS